MIIKHAMLLLSSVERQTKSTYDRVLRNQYFVVGLRNRGGIDSEVRRKPENLIWWKPSKESVFEVKGLVLLSVI